MARGYREFDPQLGDLENVTNALWGIADALDELGFGRAHNPAGQGAFEGHTMRMQSVLQEIAAALTALAEGDTR